MPIPHMPQLKKLLQSHQTADRTENYFCRIVSKHVNVITKTQFDRATRGLYRDIIIMKSCEPITFQDALQVKQQSCLRPSNPLLKMKSKQEGVELTLVMYRYDTRYSPTYVLWSSCARFIVCSGIQTQKCIKTCTGYICLSCTYFLRNTAHIHLCEKNKRKRKQIVIYTLLGSCM